MQGLDEKFEVSIEQQARMELDLEERFEAVQATKARIRARQAAKRWWHGLIPFTVKIERRQ